jgi:hypothetical protein
MITTLCAGLNILYHAINTLPVAILETDMVCENSSVLYKGETAACQVSKGAIHLVQMSFYLVAAQLVSRF